jgi:hypothetical protein
MLPPHNCPYKFLAGSIRLHCSKCHVKQSSITPAQSFRLASVSLTMWSTTSLRDHTGTVRSELPVFFKLIWPASLSKTSTAVHKYMLMWTFTCEENERADCKTVQASLANCIFGTKGTISVVVTLNAPECYRQVSPQLRRRRRSGKTKRVSRVYSNFEASRLVFRFRAF